jgi:hypothetical protein
VLTATGDIADERFVNAFINSVIAETGRIDYAVRISFIFSPEAIGGLLYRKRSTVLEFLAITNLRQTLRYQNSIVLTISIIEDVGCHHEQSFEQ